MTDTLILLVIIIAVGLLAAVPGLVSLRQRGENGSGSMMALMRQLTDCMQQRDGYSSQIAELQRSLAALQDRVETQEAEITSLRNVIVSMSTAPTRSSRNQQRAADRTVQERRRDIWQQELNTAQIQLARVEAQQTESGPDVHLDTQIERIRDRITELENLLDNRND